MTISGALSTDPVVAGMQRAWQIPSLWNFTGPDGICGLHWHCDAPTERYLGSALPEDYLVFSLHTAPIHCADVKLDRRSRFNGMLDRMSWMLVSSNGTPEAVAEGPFSVVHLYLPGARVTSLAESYGIRFDLPEPGHCLHGGFRDNPMAARVAALMRSIGEATPLAALRRDQLCHQILADLLELSTTAKRAPGSERRTPERLAPAVRRRIDAMIEAHLGRPLALCDMAAEAALSPSHFLRAFKGSFGRTPLRELQSRRIARARQLVTRSDLSLCAIALDCGFADHSHMTRHFRATFGMTPSDLRRNR